MELKVLRLYWQKKSNTSLVLLLPIAYCFSSNLSDSQFLIISAFFKYIRILLLRTFLRNSGSQIMIKKILRKGLFSIQKLSLSIPIESLHKQINAVLWAQERIGVGEGGEGYSDFLTTTCGSISSNILFVAPIKDLKDVYNCLLRPSWAYWG